MKQCVNGQFKTAIGCPKQLPAAAARETKQLCFSKSKVRQTKKSFITICCRVKTLGIQRILWLQVMHFQRMKMRFFESCNVNKSLKSWTSPPENKDEECRSGNRSQIWRPNRLKPLHMKKGTYEHYCNMEEGINT